MTGTREGDTQAGKATSTDAFVARKGLRHAVDVCIVAGLWIVVAGVGLATMAVLFLAFSPSYHAYYITSGSMEPAISTGDVVIVAPPGGLLGHPIQPGAVVTYRLGGELITHRVVSVEGGRVVTQGDAVGAADQQRTPISQLMGVVVARIPKVGFVPAFLRSGLGLLMIAASAACAGLALFVKKTGPRGLRAAWPTHKRT